MLALLNRNEALWLERNGRFLIVYADSESVTIVIVDKKADHASELAVQFRTADEPPNQNSSGAEDAIYTHAHLLHLRV